MIKAMFILGVFLLGSKLQAQDCVIFIHGMARTSYSMSGIRRFFKKNSFHTVNIGYRFNYAPIEELSQTLIPEALEECSKKQFKKVHFVTHSLGGIILRHYLEKIEVPQKLGRVVMLAPPNKGSALIDKLGNYDFIELWNGPAGAQLSSHADSLPNQLGGAFDYQLGIIAGDEVSFLDRILKSIMGNTPHDGKVTVESTKLEGMTDHLVLGLNHTNIMKSKEVYKQSLNFIQHGFFL